MPRVAPAVLFLLVALVGKTLVKESEGLAKPLLQPPSGPPQDFTAGRALAMEQMREVAARPHARNTLAAPLTPPAAPLSSPQRVPRRLQRFMATDLPSWALPAASRSGGFHTWRLTCLVGPCMQPLDLGASIHGD